MASFIIAPVAIEFAAIASVGTIVSLSVGLHDGHWGYPSCVPPEPEDSMAITLPVPSLAATVPVHPLKCYNIAPNVCVVVKEYPSPGVRCHPPVLRRLLTLLHSQLISMKYSSPCCQIAPYKGDYSMPIIPLIPNYYR